MPEVMALRLGGWRTSSMLHRYFVVNEEDAARALDRAEQHYEAERQGARKVVRLRAVQ